MKRVYILFAFLAATSALSAQSEIFLQKLRWGLRHLVAARSLEQMDKAVSIFKDLSKDNNGSYLPDYYAALSLLFKTNYFEDVSARDSLADEALEYIAKAEALPHDQAELEFLRGYALTTKMIIDPEHRGEAYAPQIMDHYEKVMALEPKNPRAPTFLALNMKVMPEFFYSDTHDPCALARSGKQLYQGYHKDNLLVWGEETADRLLQECN